MSDSVEKLRDALYGIENNVGDLDTPLSVETIQNFIRGRLSDAHNALHAIEGRERWDVQKRNELAAAHIEIDRLHEKLRQADELLATYQNRDGASAAASAPSEEAR